MASYPGIRPTAARQDQHQPPTSHAAFGPELQVPTLFLAQNSYSSTADHPGQSTHIPRPGTMIQTARMPIQNAIPNSSIMVQRPHYRPPYSSYESFTPTPDHQQQIAGNLVDTPLPVSSLSTAQTSLPNWPSPLQERSPQSGGIHSPHEQRTTNTPCPISSPVSSGKPVVELFFLNQPFTCLSTCQTNIIGLQVSRRASLVSSLLTFLLVFVHPRDPQYTLLSRYCFQSVQRKILSCTLDPIELCAVHSFIHTP